MKTLSLLVLILIGLISPAGAVVEWDNRCWSDDKIERVRSKFELEVKPGVAEYKKCDWNNAYYQTLAGLVLMDLMGELNETNDKYDQAIIGKNPFDYFSSRATKIVIESSCHQALAYVRPQLSKSTVHVCPGIEDAGALYIGAIMVHEVRHFDDFDHVPCSGPHNRGVLACDSKYAEQGAYAVSTEFLVKVSRTPNLEPSIRKQARSKAITEFIQRFNSRPFDIEEGVALLNDRNKLYFYDGEKPVQVGSSPGKDYVMISSDDFVTFAGAKKKERLKFDYRESYDKDDFGYKPRYLEGLTAKEIPKFRDQSLYGKFACTLFSDQLRCISSDLKEVERVDIPSKSAVSFIYSELSGIVESEQLYVVDKSGTLYFVPKTWEELKETSSLRVSETRLSLISIGPWGDASEIVVQQDGRVMIYDWTSAQWSSAPHLEKFKAKKMFAPFYWSKKLQQL